MANETNTSLNCTNKQNNNELNINASLKHVYKQLIPPLITQRVYDDLSICIVFQMILFLANEHVSIQLIFLVNCFFFIRFKIFILLEFTAQK